MKRNLYTKKDNLNRSIGEKASQWYHLVCLLFFFVALSQAAHAQISGVVYRDFNEDGVRSYTATTVGEIGVSGVTVNVYNSSGLVGTTTTSSATATVGSYTVTPSGAGPYRVEFVNLPTGYFDGLRGSASGTSVQFVASSPATNVNLGINYPTDYCQTAPNFIVPCYVNGNPLGGGTSATQPVLVTLPYSNTGNTPSESIAATNVQIGTVYGVAYQRTSKVVFTSAFVKRHSGLGTGGAGAIYITVPSSGTTYTSSLFATLPTAVSAVSAATIGGTTVVGTNAVRSLPASTTVANYDAATFDQVGKAGLGDIELSEDGTQLYAVNLGDRRLYQIPINNANTTSPTAATASITSYALPTSITQTTGSVLRPFGLKVHRGRVYVGAVTTNEAVSTTANFGTGSTGTTSLITRDPSTMVAYVFEFNPVNSSFTTVLSFPLSYTKGASDNDQTGVSRSDRWYPWVSVQPSYPTPTAGQLPNRYSRNDLANASYPQPILSGIEFDVDGSMILSIRDRFGDQYGNNNYGVDPTGTNTQLYRAISPGDILRAGQCTPGVNQWTLESNARICSGTATLGANTGQGPGGGEYYYSDAVSVGDNPGGVFRPYHAEMSEGGLALFPGRDEVASIVMDPTDNIDSGGIRRFKNSNGSGSPSTSVQVYASGNVATYGKANGLGDLELSCDEPPIQIGNRVFRDLNNNGIQDPGEPGLAGVQVILRGPGSSTIATATTDANGEYYFSSGAGTNTASSIANLTLTAGGSYTLSFPTSVSAFSISTFPNAGTGTNGEAIDSDPNAAGVISFTLGSAGQNNFTYDAGYACTPLALTLTSGTICAGQTVSLTATSGFSSYTFSSGLTQVGTTNVASGSVNGTYSVTAVNSFGCSGTATGSITVNALPVVTLTSATICAGQSATLTATSGFTNYTFSSGLTRIGTTNQATSSTAGTYSVTVVNSSGCVGVSSGAGSGTITVNALPTVTLSSATICAGQTASLTATAGLSSYTFSPGLTQVGTTNVASSTAAGTYSVTAINSAGCSATATGSITVNPVPALTLSSATICAGQTATLTAGVTGFATYTFSSGLTRIGTTNQATSTTAGTYSVTATTALGCSTTATGTITVNPVPALTLSSATICAGQTATLTAGGTGFTTYAFSTSLTQVGASNNQATGTTAGTYSVTATTALGCSTTATGSIIVNPVPALVLSSATICAGQTATLTAGGTGFATYAFSSGLTRIGTTNQATSTTAGTYSVTATTALGCSTTATGTITINPVPALTLSSTTICAGQTATLTAGGTGFATYVFSSGLTQIGTTNQAIGTTAGTYSVTATTALGCSTTATGSITINTNPVIVLSSATVCVGQTAVLTATTGYDTYLFSAGLTQVGNSNVATGTTAGTYSVTAISNAGCSATATGTITVNPLPVVSLTSATVCAGQSATLVATAGLASYQFSAGLTPVSGTPNTAIGTTSGAYSVTVTSSDGCVNTGAGSITVNPLPVVSLTSATICAGQTASLTATAGYASYVFSAGLTQLGSSNVAVGTTGGTYSVTAISTEGCSATATGSITINTNPVIVLSSATICAGQTAVLTATTGYDTYLFSAGLTQVSNSNVATGITAGTYSVTAISNAGCSASATASITVNPLPVVSLTSATICAGQSATLVATAGFASYQFSAGLTPMPGQANMATGTTGGVYSVTAISTEGCVNTGSGSITVNPLPVVSLSSATICAGQTASLTATAGYASYVFSAGLTQLGSSNVAVGTTGGTYSVTATSTEGCSATATGSITINTNPVIVLSSATVCVGQTAVLTATTGYDTYLFSAGLTQVGNSNVATGTTAGTYSVTAISNAGCSASATASITVNPLPVVSLTSATICAGQSATLVATAGLASYQFSAGLTPVSGTPNTAIGTTSGTYSVTAVSADGCVNTGSGSITVNPLPVVSLSSATICAGQTASLTATAGYASYVFSAGLTQLSSSNVAIGTTGGTYSVTATSTEGCSATATGSITVNPLPVVTLSSATICSGQLATLVATAGYANYSFSAGLTQVGTSNVATGVATGAYSVTVTTLEGCSATATGSIMVNPTPLVALSSMTICEGQTASLTATAGYDSYVFSAGLTAVPGTSNVATGTLNGTYSVTAISSAGCIGTATGSITVNPAVVVTLSSATICAGQIGVLTATAGYDTYIFSAGLTQNGASNVASGSVEGIYSVTAISSGGCVGTATGSITVNPTAVVTLNSATICAGQSATLTATPGFTDYVFSAGLTVVPGTPNAATGTLNGTYSVTASSSAGCIGTATGSITVNAQPSALITVSSTTICQGQSATLTASGGDLYNWSTNEQTASLIVTTSGVYSVTVSTVNGCSDVASTTITVNPLPVLTVNSATICSGQSTTLTLNGCTGGTVLWSNLANTASIQVSPSVTTTYSATCTLETGCSSTTSTTVTVTDIPSYTAAPQAITATCTGSAANNDARIVLTTLQNTERADIVTGSTYGNGPAYGAPTNLTVTAGTVSFLNLPNPGSSQPYTIRLYNPGGTCYTDVTVILEPSSCNCPDPKCVPVVIQKTKLGRRTAVR